MKSLKQEHFYYGAILTSIMEYNPDTSLVLLQPQNDSRKVYRIQTNSSQECVIFFKHAFEKKEGSQSWVYRFSDTDKQFLKECHENKIPTFIYLLCAVNNLKGSEIAVLRYDEFAEVVERYSIFALSFFYYILRPYVCIFPYIAVYLIIT